MMYVDLGVMGVGGSSLGPHVGWGVAMIMTSLPSSGGITTQRGGYTFKLCPGYQDVLPSFRMYRPS